MGVQEAATYPDWGKMEFRVFPPRSWTEILPDASIAAKDLVSRLVRYESGDRLSAAKVSGVQSPSLRSR